MDHPSLDAIAERIARLGRRDSDTAISPPPAAPEQWKRVAGMVDDAVIAMTGALDRVEARNRQAIESSEAKAARALDAVSNWMERQTPSRQRNQGQDEQDVVFNRMISRLTERLESIDQRLSASPDRSVDPLRATVQNVADRLERVGRSTRTRDERATIMGDMMKDLDGRIRHLQDQLDQEERAPARSASRFQCDQADNIERIERQLADVLATVQDRKAQTRPHNEPSTRPLVARDFAATVTEIEARQRSLDNDNRGFGPLLKEVKDVRDVTGRTQEALSNLRQEVGRLSGQFSQRDGRALQGLEAQIRSIGENLTELAPRHQVTALETSVKDLMKQIAAMRSEGMRESDLAPIERLLADIRLSIESYREPQGLDEINREIAGLRRQIERGDFASGDRTAIHALESQIADLRELVGRTDHSGQLRLLEQRIGHVSESLDRWQHDERERNSSSDTNAEFRRLDQRIGQISESLDRWQRDAATRSDDRAIYGAIDEIRGLVGSIDPGRAIADVEQRLSHRLIEQARQIEAKIEAARRGQAPEPEIGAMVDILAQRLDSIQKTLDQPPAPSEDLERVAQHVIMLEDKIDRLPQTSGDPALAGIVRDLAVKIESVEGRMPDVLALGEAVRRLADQVESGIGASGSDPDLPLLIERHIGDAVSRLERNANPSLLANLERSVGDLFAQIESLRGSQSTASAEAAESAVRNALKSLAPESIAAAANEGVAVLARDISSLRVMQDASDRRSQDTLAAVHDTLERIVDRLAMLEVDVTEARRKVASEDLAGFAQPQITMPSVGSGPFSSALNASSAPAFQPPMSDKPAPTPAFQAPQAPTPPFEAPRFEPSTPARLAPAIEPAAKGGSLFSSMKQMITRKGEDEPALPAIEPVKAQTPPPGLSDQAFDEDMPLDPLTGQPRVPFGAAKSLEIEPARLADSPGDTAARSDFLKLARQAMSAGANQPVEKLEKAAKGAKPPKARMPSIEMNGKATASTARKVMPLLGAAAVVAAAGVGASMWLRNQSETVSIEQPADPAAEIQTQQPAAPNQQSSNETAPAAAAPRKIDVSAAPQKDPESTASLPETERSTSKGPDQPIPAENGPLAAMPADPAITGSAPSQTAGDFAAWPTKPQLSKTEPEEVLKQVRKLADAGDATALYDLGQRASDGRGVPKDAKAAFAWFEKAANKGLAPAQYRMGTLYREGKGVTANNVKAKDWFKRAATRGNARAMHNLAVVLAEGVGGTPDYAAAAEWFEKAADFGIKDSQFNVAILFARGLGVPQDLAAAYKWFDAAAQQGDDDAAKKRDEIAGRLDGPRLKLAKDESTAFKAKPLDPETNEVTIPSYETTAERKDEKAAPKS